MHWLPATHEELVQRRLVAEHPDQLWATDIVKHPATAGNVYCCAVIAACSRTVVGWFIADHMRTELVVDALQMALRRRTISQGSILHLNKGITG